ncbi:hypothetical protein BKK54_04405 [Rodentibacter genomosp. 1]|uniref:DUF1266 domain-containing protein n=2 Tax=Rodentibacter genomosp. 1 TaxID=1908264 RepID=A0A1V3J7Q6_9PAST|nr:hypothetical protein BKK54_04405 [Rodentibacter genomosp. 1]
MSIASELKSQDLKKGRVSQAKGVVLVLLSVALIANTFLNIVPLSGEAWILWSGIVLLALFGLGKLFMGWVHISAVKQKIGEPFFGLLTMPEPKVPLQNDEEKYAFLVYGFYESSQVLQDDGEGVLKKDPLIRPEKEVKYSDALALNDFYGIYNEAESTVKSSLSTAWDINSAEEARETISGLWNGALEGADTAIMAYPHAEDLIQSLKEVGFDIKGIDAAKINVSGFDLVRTIWIARNSYVAGYIEADEVRAISRNVAEFTAANYANWNELGYSYLVSYLAWLYDAKPSLAYNMLQERVYAVSQYISSPHSPLAGTSLDELRTYFDSLPDNEEN